MSAREDIDAAAAEHGWEMVSDQGYRVEFTRGLETLRVYFSDDDAGRGRRLTNVYNDYPTGDRTALNGDPCYAVRGKDTRDKGKREAALEWLADTHYARPGTNELLVRLGFEPVLPEAPFDAEAFAAEVKATGWAGPLDGRRGTV